MTKCWNVNVSSSVGGSSAIFNLKQTMGEAGWTFPKGSDGSTYNAAGDQITHSGSGAGGLDNHLAWFQANDPGGRRQYIFQTSGTIPGKFWKIYFSELGTLGTGSVTIPPTGSDVGVIYGGGFGVSQGDQPFNGPNQFGPALYNDPPGTYLCHAIAFSTPVPGSNVYTFFSFTSKKGTGIVNGIVLADGLLSGTYHPLDVSPVVHIACSSSNTATGFDSSNALETTTWNAISASGWIKYGYSDGRYKRLNIPTTMIQHFSTTPGRPSSIFSTTDLYDGNRWEWITYAYNANISTRTAPFGIKGFLYNIKIPISTDIYPATLNLDSPDARTYLGVGTWLTIPWASGVAGIV
jgi:hypothetical protein